MNQESTPYSLRQIAPSDDAMLRAWATIPALSEYFRRQPPEYAARYDYNDRHSWVIEIEGAPAGLANLADFDPTGRKCTFGILVIPQARPVAGVKLYQWLFKKVVGEYVFNYLSYNKVYCLTLPHRTALHETLEKVGAQKEATLRENIFWQGRYWDEVMHSVTATQFREMNK